MDRRQPGDFNYRALAGNYDFDAGQIVDPAPLFGLGRDGQYVYGAFRDGDGNLYCMLRKIELNLYSQQFSVQDNRGKDAMRVDRVLTGRMFGGPTTATRDGETVRFAPYLPGTAAASTTTAPDFALAMAPDRIAWNEGGFAALAGTPVGPGMQWYAPYHKGGALYLSAGYRVEGEFDGRTVSGFAFFDQFYLPPGVTWTRDPFVNELELRWHTFGNLYDDGTAEVGHFAFGHGEWGFALVNDDRTGSLHATNDITCAITARDAEGYWPERIETVADGVKWIWQGNPAGRMIDLQRRLNPNSAGIETREGETRAIALQICWGETCPSHGDRRKN